MATDGDAAPQQGSDDDVEAYIAAIENENLAHERAHLMARLADTYRVAKRWVDAETTARVAVAHAKQAGHEAGADAAAHAHLILGTLLFDMFFDAGPEPEPHWDGFREALDVLEQAATRYKELGRVDFYVCLLSMAEAFRRIGELETAETFYNRITLGLSEERWAETASLARYTNQLRARAFRGLSSIAVAHEDLATARARLDTSVGLLLPSGRGDRVAVVLLEEASHIFRDTFDDSSRADEVLTAARALSGAGD